MGSITRRCSKSGEVSFRARVRLKGFPIQVATFRRITDAKKWICATQSAIKEGRHFKVSEAKRRTLGEAIDKYKATVLPGKPKSTVTQAAQLERWRRELGSYSLSEITPRLLTSVRDKLRSELTQYGSPRKPASVNRYLAVMSHLLSVASIEWEWLDENPMSKVRKLAEPSGRVRFLSDQEREALVTACRQSVSANLYPIVVLALSTGMRRAEILNLRWPDVDLIRARLFLNQTKNGERRGIPITGLALSILREHSKVRQLNSDWVFPSRTSCSTGQPVDIRTAWEGALRTAKIENFRFHDLRHSCASYLAMNGATLAEIAEVLGHKTFSMVKRYSHLSDSHTSKVVERMTAKMFGA